VAATTPRTCASGFVCSSSLCLFHAFLPVCLLCITQANVLARVSGHPNVVRIFHWCIIETDDRRASLTASLPSPILKMAMEYVSGGDLYKLCKSGIGLGASPAPASRDEAVLPLFAGLALGIEHIHRNRCGFLSVL
jgi:serine/threonine protein kinase